MERKTIKDIFHYEKEEMNRAIRWVFGLPLAYSLYLVISMLVPTFGTSSNLLLVKNIIIYSILLFCVVFVIRRFLGFDFKLFVTETLFFNFRKLCFGFLTMMILCINTSFILMAFDSSSFAFTLEGNPVLNWFLSLVLVCIAAFCEELIYRGYVAHFLQDHLESCFKKQLAYCLVSGLLFSVAHLSNPELSTSVIIPCLFYFIMGFFLMAFVFITGGLEFSLGVHIANNLVTAWFFSYPNSVLKTNALFTHYASVSPITIAQVLVCLIGCYIVAKKVH